MKTVRACTFEGCDSEPPLYRNKYNENHVWCEGHMISHGIIKRKREIQRLE